jgi:UV DNA damage endonuclease
MGIKLFRISSDIIPFGSHPVNKLFWWEEFGESITQIGRKITGSGIRASMHPGQYTVLNSKNSDVVDNAVSDLIYHCKLLDALGLDASNKIIIHVGGVYGDKKKGAEAFRLNYLKLPENIKNRLVVENDDKNYTAEDVLNISRILEVPVVFDNLHNKLNPSLENIQEQNLIDICRSTWKQSDGAQKIHYSQQKAGGTAGSHSDTIHVEEFMKFYKSLNDKNIDIMLEVKDKNMSCLKCINSISEITSIKNLEEEWEKYKYFVLSRSVKIYSEICESLKGKEDVNVVKFYKKIEQAFYTVEDKRAQVNAAQDIWGYINKNCKEVEKRRFHKLIKGYTDNGGGLKALKNHLLKCAIEQDIKYLINSYYFYI